jgi:Ca-activated chloride channel family protein
MLPRTPGDLFRGQQLLVVGRYRGNGDKLVRLTGNLGTSAQTHDFEGTFPEEERDNAFIAQLWAYRQVGVLLDQVRLSGETPELKQEIIQLATRFGIVTPYTSYLVVEDTPLAGRPPMPRPPDRPVLMRQPGSMGGGFGNNGGAAPAPTEAEADAVGTAREKGEFRKEDGKAGVRAAKTLQRMKDKSTADSEVASVRHASGRAFYFRGDAWVDTTFDAKLQVLRIAPYTKAWLQIAAANASLRPALALGERVSIVVGKWVLVVAPGGKSALSDAELAPFKK